MKSSSTKLRTAYGLSLALIAALALASHWLLNSVNATLEADAQTINIAGRQRALSQQIANLSQRIKVDGLGNQVAVEGRLREAVETWSATHSRLQAGANNRDRSNANSAEIAAILLELDRSIAEVGTQVEALLAEAADPAAGTASPGTPPLQTILATTDRYLPKMDHVVSLYEAGLREDVASLARLEILATGLTVATLLFLALFVFEPTIRRNERNSFELLALRRAIDEHALFSVTDRRGVILDANDRFCEVSGYSRSELIGETHKLLNSGHHATDFWREMWQTISSGKTWHGEVCNRAKDGSMYWVQSTNIPLFSSNGRIERYYSMRFDISEAKLAKTEHESTRAFLEAVLDAATEIALITLDPEGTVTSFNDGAQRMLGYREDEMIGRDPLSDLYLPEEVAARSRALSRENGFRIEGFDVFAWEARRGGFEQGQWTYVRKDGSRLQVMLTVTAIRSADDELTGFLCVALDISERLEAERLLEEQRAEQKSIVDAIPGVIFYKDNQNNILDCNQRAASVLGTTREDIRGRSVSEFFPPELAKRYWDRDMRALDAGTPILGTMESFDQEDGSTAYVHIDRVPVRGPSGELDRIVVASTEVTELVRANQQTRVAEERLDLALQVSNTGLWDWNCATGKMLYNASFCTQLGYRPGSLANDMTTWGELVHPDDLERVKAALEHHLLGHSESYSTEHRLLRSDGAWQWTRDVGRVVERDDNGLPLRMVGVHIDIQALRDALSSIEAANTDLANAQQRLELAVEGSRDALFDWNIEEKSVFLSSRWAEFLGIDPEDLQQNFDDVSARMHDSDRGRIEGQLRKFIEYGEAQFDAEFRLVSDEDEHRWVMLRAVAVRDEAGKALRITGSAADITNLKTAQSELERLVRTDYLTGLASRTRLIERLEHALARSRRNGSVCGLLFFDFDRFKVVNDSLGHEAGDELLCSIASRLKNNVREVDTAARIGGDEFVVLLEDIESPDNANLVAGKLLAVCAEPHTIRGNTIASSASIGVVTSQQAADSASALLGFADAAMYEAKRRGRGCVVEFDEAMYREQMLHAELEEDLHLAVERNQLELNFQPIVDLETGGIQSAEVLLRWNHPRRGRISPLMFIPIAEESKHIVPIGSWLIGAACRQLVHWRQSGIVSEAFALSINISKVQLLTPGFEDDLVGQIDAAGLPRTALKIEVTETTIVDNRSDIIEVLSSLREKSIIVMMDDFGTGHSSLSGLHALPIDELKIDQSFIRHADGNRELVAITSSIVSLAEQLSLKTIGEGVETANHILLLQAMGCMYGQGYFWSKPADAAQFESILQEHSAQAGDGPAKDASAKPS